MWIDRETLPGDATQNEFDTELLAKAGGCKRPHDVAAAADAENQGLAAFSERFRNVQAA